MAGFLDTVVVPDAKAAAAPVAPSPVSAPAPVAKGAGSFLSNVVLPSNPAQVQKVATISQEADQAQAASNSANSFGGIFKNTVGSIFNTVKNFGSNLIQSYTQPDQFEQNLEGNVPAVLKPVEAPLLRTFAPMIEPLATDITAAGILNTPQLNDLFTQALQDKNASQGEQNAQQSLIAASQKTAPQIVGDTAQAVLGAYAPDVFGEDLDAFGATGAKQAVAASVGHGAQYGFTYGLAQAASSGSNDPKELAGIVLKSTIGGALLNLATAAVAHGVAKTVPEALSTIRAKVPESIAEDVPKAPTDIATTENPAPEPEAPTAVAPAAENEPVANETAPEATPAPIADKVAPESTAALVVSDEQPNNTANKTSVSGLAQSVKTEAVTAGLDDSIGKLPEYGTMDMKEQARLAKAIIAKDPEFAMKVAKGEVPSPEPKLLPESVFTAFRVMARETDDVEMAADINRQLAEDSATTRLARVRGQQIKALDSGLGGTHEDAVSVMQDVKESRQAVVEKKNPGAIAKAKKEISSDITKEIKKGASKRQTWSEFVESISC